MSENKKHEGPSGHNGSQLLVSGSKPGSTQRSAEHEGFQGKPRELPPWEGLHWHSSHCHCLTSPQNLAACIIFYYYLSRLWAQPDGSHASHVVQLQFNGCQGCRHLHSISLKSGLDAGCEWDLSAGVSGVPTHGLSMWPGLVHDMVAWFQGGPFHKNQVEVVSPLTT